MFIKTSDADIFCHVYGQSLVICLNEGIAGILKHVIYFSVFYDVPTKGN